MQYTIIHLSTQILLLLSAHDCASQLQTDISSKLEGARESAYLRQVKWCKHKKKGGRRKSHFAAKEGGKRNSRRCYLHCWCNDVIAIISHHVHKLTYGTTDRTISLLISSNVHYVHLAEIINKQKVATLHPKLSSDTADTTSDPRLSLLKHLNGEPASQKQTLEYTTTRKQSEPAHLCQGNVVR